MSTTTTTTTTLSPLHPHPIYPPPLTPLLLLAPLHANKPVTGQHIDTGPKCCKHVCPTSAGFQTRRPVKRTLQSLTSFACHYSTGSESICHRRELLRKQSVNHCETQIQLLNLIVGPRHSLVGWNEVWETKRILTP